MDVVHDIEHLEIDSDNEEKPACDVRICACGPLPNNETSYETSKSSRTVSGLSRRSYRSDMATQNIDIKKAGAQETYKRSNSPNDFENGARRARATNPSLDTSEPMYKDKYRYSTARRTTKYNVKPPKRYRSRSPRLRNLKQEQKEHRRNAEDTLWANEVRGKAVRLKLHEDSVTYKGRGRMTFCEPAKDGRLSQEFSL